MKFNPNRKIYLFCDSGSLGDTICTFPAIRMLVDEGGIEKMFINDGYRELYELCFPKHLIVRIKDIQKVLPKEEVTEEVPEDCIDPETGNATFMEYPMIPGYPVVHTHSRTSALLVHAHLIDGFSSAITNCIFKENEKDYPTIPKHKLPHNPFEGSNYAVVSYGSTTEHRKMLPEALYEIKEYLRSKDIKTVLLGNRTHTLTVGADKVHPVFEGLDTEGCIDMIDKTSILEALAIMMDARVVIGIDGGLLHLAGMTDAPIVMGFTTVDPYYRVPYRKGVKGERVYPVEPDTECKYCQTAVCLNFNIHYNICNTKTLECMNSLTPDKWIAQIEKALNNG